MTRSTTSTNTNQRYDLIVIGAGIAGLSAAALFARDGYRVLVLEGHIEAGGCASSYERKRPDGGRYVFDVGATLFAGFTPGGAHHWVGQQLGIRWPVRPLDPAMEVWLPDRRISRWGDPLHWQAERQAAFGSDQRGSESFWREQEQAAEIAWRFAGRHPQLPLEQPSDLIGLIPTIRPELALLLPGLVSTVAGRVRAHGAASNRRLRSYIDGQLLISAQTTAERCAWLYGAVALDFARIGAHYAEGGAWSLTRTLLQALERDGGEIRYRQWVTRIVTERGRAVAVETAQGERFDARVIIANTTHWDVARLLGRATPATLEHAIQRMPQGWGAFMLYLGVEEAAIPHDLAEHHQVIADYDRPLGEANSVFISLHPSDDTSRAPQGQRAVTISTHTDVSRWWMWRNQSMARYREEKAAMAERLLQTASIAMPRLRQHLRYQQAGTPVTFQRYTNRHLGMVGGLPQTPWTYGLLSLGPRAAGVQNLFMVGDSTFPGQSTAAVTQSAIRAYQTIVRKWAWYTR
ncbi:MAG: C-3',4' desaturase CrtD [Roseiflexaceae bacterium]